MGSAGVPRTIWKVAYSIFGGISARDRSGNPYTREAVLAATNYERQPTQKTALYTSGAVFAAVAVAHLVRLATGFEIIVGGAILPMWVSFLGALIAALLAVWMVFAARRL